MSHRTPTLAIADDHEALRARLESLLEPGFDIVASVGDGLELLDAVERFQPDVLVLDLDMPRLTGLDTIRELGRRGHHGPVVVISITEDLDVVEEALRLGARAYVAKSRIATELVPALTAALRGSTFVSLTAEDRGGKTS
jgi:DNA-binding NarL/FixJ family response regulator